MIPMGTFFATGVGFTGTIWTETVKAKASLTPIDSLPGYFTLWLDGRLAGSAKVMAQTPFGPDLHLTFDPWVLPQYRYGRLQPQGHVLVLTGARSGR